MDEINKKCQSAIDNENTFLLSFIPGLKILVSTENPLYVDQIFPRYRYMNLLQYSIAAKKPKSLQFLLNFALGECKIPLKKIIKPTQTPPRDMNLIVLAIEFHSNDCLKVLVNFILDNQDDKEKFDFDIEDQFGETPLTKALRDKNDEAALILINQCKADIMHKADEENSILRPLLPIIVFLLNYTTSYEINQLWDKIEEDIRLKVIDEIKILSFDSNFRISDGGVSLKDLFKEKDLIDANTFIIDQTIKRDKSMKTLEKSSVPDNKNDDEPLPNNDSPKKDVKKCSNEKDKCSNEGCVKCPRCKKIYCDQCIGNHLCQP